MKKYILGAAGFVLLVLFIIKWNSFNISNTSWVAEYVIDNKIDTLQIDSEKISIQFKEDQYTFFSTLNQKETGSYRRKGKSLILTTDGSSSPYRIDILSASEEKLVLQMTVEAGSRNLVLKPVK